MLLAEAGGLHTCTMSQGLYNFQVSKLCMRMQLTMVACVA